MKQFLPSPTRGPAHEQRHYFSIDLLRGLAAMAVLFCHYAFFYAPRSNAEFSFQEMNRQPLYFLLWPLYDHGARAVQLFWMISGFVFSAVYIGRRTGARTFFVHRFSRLYPLHFVTLLTVAAIVVWSNRVLGYFPVLHHNDLYHFILNLLFISGGASFNFPIWSVSVEIVIYCVFFVSLPVLLRAGLLGSVAATGLFWALNRLQLPTPVPACGLYFFMGSSVFVFLKSCPRLALPVGAALIALAIPLLLGWHTGFLFGGRLLFVFSGVILILGYIDERYEFGTVKSRLAWVGECTYSIYLLGLPLQFALMCGLDFAGIDRTRLADSPWFLVCFMGSVLFLARLSFLAFERPMQTLLRNWMLPGIRVVARAA